MPTSRDRRDRSHHHSRSRSRSQERRSPNETDSGGKTEKPSADSRNRVPSPQNKEQLEHLVRRMLAVTLRKFESGSDKGEGHERREKRDHHERNEDRRGEERQETRAPDNDLAKLVLGQVLQFTVRRYLKNREKKRLQATKKAKAKMPKMPVPLPIPIPGPGMSGPPSGLPDRGLDRGMDRSMPPPSSYPPPPRQQRVDRYNDLIDDRHERRERHLERRLERRMERERQDRLDRQERLDRLDRLHDRYEYNPSLPRRVPREPLPRSSPLWEPPRDLPRERDSHPLRRVRDPLPPRPFRPYPPDSRPSDRPNISPQSPLDPLPRKSREVDDLPGPPLKSPPPHPFSWESVPVFPPAGHRETSFPHRPKDKATERCPADPLTPPISPQRPYVPLEDPKVNMITPMDELAHALDELLIQLRRTDGLVYRAVCRPSLDEDGQQWYERDTLREHASDLQRSLMRATAEARVMREAIRRRDCRDKDKFKIQEQREQREQPKKKRVTVQLPEEV